MWFGMKAWGFYSGTELWPIYPTTQYNTMQTLTLPLSVPQSACMLLKGNMELLKSQKMQRVFASVLFSYPEKDSDSQIIISVLRLSPTLTPQHVSFLDL